MLHSYRHEQGYAVDIFVRADGSFGFEHFRRDIEDAGRWTMMGSYAGERFVTPREAQEAASERNTWFDPGGVSCTSDLRDPDIRHEVLPYHQAGVRDAAVRARMVELLEASVAGSDELTADARAELRGRIREDPGWWRYLRVTASGLLRLDRTKIAQHAKLDGKTMLRTSDLTP